jgi:hypothetical protein
MADITVISTKVVEVVGLLQGRAEATARPPPPRAPPKSSNVAVGLQSSGSDARNSLALRSANSRLSLRNNLSDAPPRPPTPPPANQPRSDRPPPSGTPFLAQKIGQESTFRSRSLQRFESAVDAYKKAQSSTSAPRRDGVVEFLTQDVNVLV